MKVVFLALIIQLVTLQIIVEVQGNSEDKTNTFRNYLNFHNLARKQNEKLISLGLEPASKWIKYENSKEPCICTVPEEQKEKEAFVSNLKNNIIFSVQVTMYLMLINIFLTIVKKMFIAYI